MKAPIICAIALAACITSPVSAQSGGTDWSGFYAGAAFDSGVSQQGVAELSGYAASPRPHGEHDYDQFSALAGYTWDFGTVTLGAEVQAFSENRSGAYYDPLVGFVGLNFCRFGTVCSNAGAFSTIDPRFRVRAIGGYEVADRTRVLGGLGVTSANVTYQGAYINFSGPTYLGSTVPRVAEESDTIYALNIALGLEHQIADGLSFRMFVNHDIYESFSVTNPITATGTAFGGSATASVTDYIDYTTTSVEFGMIFRF